MPVVLVHGVPETTAVWDRLAPLLDGPVIKLGLPGFGNKRPDGFGSTMDEYAAWLETELAAYEARIQMPREFVVPGASRLSAALELTRTILRRAERRAVGLHREGHVAGTWLVPYLNRQADLVWVLARAAEQAEERSTTLARSTPRPR